MASDDPRIAELERALAEALARCAQAEQAAQAKGRLIAHVSHEIRTPLNGVLGLTELALQAAQTPSQRRHLVMAVEAGHALLQMANDLLDISRLEAGKMVLHEEPFDLPETLASVFRGVMPQMRSKGLLVRFDHRGPVHWVRGDVTRLRQIVTNLLGNAVKFTPAGELVLTAEVVVTGADTCLATIRVQDTGPGLHPALRDRLFEAFEQGGELPARGQGGAGLGLSIARGLARALGGELAVDSQPGQGCTFTLTLPFGLATDPDPLPMPAPGRAWLVFPNPHIARWVEQRLHRLGWSSLGFDTLEAAVAHAGRLALADQPQLLLVSERALRPDSNLAAARAALPQAEMHLLVRPDWNVPALEREALALGFTLNIAPLSPRDLMRMAGAAATPHSPPPPGSAPAPLPGWQGGVLLVEDNPVNQLIGEEFLKALGVPARVADSGEAALRACLAQPPQLVLMDVQMPVMDGRQTCRRLREMQHEGRLPGFPILALTAHAMGAEREQCLAAGMDGYLSKPLMLHTLREELARWLPGAVHHR
ncbi:ATP-binding protein [Ideonella sp. BN130291]|uniref:ATP-binding protein n=1 Tax=Ideonella sp. BN130291 TaxID=3112940 RepID=UPI002E254462|nr:ATP-binding protein [Ideonella sp. BN130291]